MRVRKSSSAVALLAASLVLGACSSTTPTTSVTPAPAPAPSVQEKHWGYAATPETVGPAEWGSLPGDAACATGKRQSPVDLATRPPFPVEAKDLPNLVFKYGTTRLHLVNNGHTVQVDVDPGSSVEMDGAVLASCSSSTSTRRPSTRSTASTTRWKCTSSTRDRTASPASSWASSSSRAAAPRRSRRSSPTCRRRRAGRKDDAAVTIDLATLLPENRTYLDVRRLAHDAALHRGHPLVRPAVARAASRPSSWARSSPSRDMTPSNRPTQPLTGRDGASRHDPVSARRTAAALLSMTHNWRLT